MSKDEKYVSLQSSYDEQEHRDIVASLLSKVPEFASPEEKELYEFAAISITRPKQQKTFQKTLDYKLNEVASEGNSLSTKIDLLTEISSFVKNNKEKYNAHNARALESAIMKSGFKLSAEKCIDSLEHHKLSRNTKGDIKELYRFVRKSIEADDSTSLQVALNKLDSVLRKESLDKEAKKAILSTLEDSLKKFGGNFQQNNKIIANIKAENTLLDANIREEVKKTTDDIYKLFKVPVFERTKTHRVEFMQSFLEDLKFGSSKTSVYIRDNILTRLDDKKSKDKLSIIDSAIQLNDKLEKHLDSSYANKIDRSKKQLCALYDITIQKMVKSSKETFLKDNSTAISDKKLKCKNAVEQIFDNNFRKPYMTNLEKALDNNRKVEFKDKALLIKNLLSSLEQIPKYKNKDSTQLELALTSLKSQTQKYDTANRIYNDLTNNLKTESWNLFSKNTKLDKCKNIINQVALDISNTSIGNKADVDLKRFKENLQFLIHDYKNLYKDNTSRTSSYESIIDSIQKGENQVSLNMLKALHDNKKLAELNSNVELENKIKDLEKKLESNAPNVQSIQSQPETKTPDVHPNVQTDSNQIKEQKTQKPLITKALNNDVDNPKIQAVNKEKKEYSIPYHDGKEELQLNKREAMKLLEFAKILSHKGRLDNETALQVEECANSMSPELLSKIMQAPKIRSAMQEALAGSDKQKNNSLIEQTANQKTAEPLKQNTSVENIISGLEKLQSKTIAPAPISPANGKPSAGRSI